MQRSEERLQKERDALEHKVEALEEEVVTLNDGLTDAWCSPIGFLNSYRG